MNKLVRASTAAVNSPGLHLSSADWTRLQAANARWNDDIVANRAVVPDIYGPLVRAADNSATTVSRDLPYGDDPRHRLDIFTPAGTENRPVLLFMHGGAFTRGSKSVDGAIYDNVPYWFARQGFVGVNIEYRLSPAAQFPAGAQDLALAVQWVADNIGRYGGEPRQIILMGHSAGGCHVASYLLDPETGVVPHDSIVAAILVSARLRLDMRPGNPNAKNVAAYCGDDPAVLERYSPVNHVANARWPMLIAIAEYENRYLDAYGLEFASRLGDAQGKAPWFVQLLGHNHTSAVAHFNTDDDWFGQHILAFLKS
ncbi:MAG: alpha/beta hydrolase [Pseudolabrys sp.]